MEAALSGDCENKGAVSKDSNKAGNEEGERDPCVLVFESREAQKNEEQVASTSVVGVAMPKTSQLSWYTEFGSHLFSLPTEVNWIGVGAVETSFFIA